MHTALNPGTGRGTQSLSPGENRVRVVFRGKD